MNSQKRSYKTLKSFTQIPFLVFLFLASLHVHGQDEFVITIKTDNPGFSGSTEFFIQVDPSAGPYLFDVDWDGDGIYQGIHQNYITSCGHDYLVPGIYEIHIRGTFPAIYFNNQADKEKILTVEQWGDIQWGSFRNAFFGCSILQINASDAPDLTQVTDMSGTFRSCTALNDNIGGWNMSNILSTKYMFKDATSFNQPLNGWNVSNVQTMLGMFNSATSFNRPLYLWNVGSVTNMLSMFNGASAYNQDLNNWNVSSVTTMRTMFTNASNFNGVIGNWNVSMVTDMRAMFQNAISFNQSISNWNTSSVLLMRQMFSGANNYNQDMNYNAGTNAWNVAPVTDMSEMFQNAFAFNGNISNWTINSLQTMAFMFNNATNFNNNITLWDPALVSTMQGTFFGAVNFNQDISSWDMSSVSTMQNMFNSASAFDQNIGTWPVHNVTNMSNMFLGVQLSIVNYDALLIGWNGQSLKPNVPFHAGTSQYCLGEGDRNNMTSIDGWSITDAGEGCPNIPPVAACTDKTIYLDQFGLATIVVSDIENGSTDSDGTITDYTLNDFNFNCLDIGSNAIMLTITDNEFATNQCTGIVTVIDDLAPNISCLNVPSTLSLDANGQVSLAFSNPSIITDDNCDPAPNLTVLPPSFDCNNIGLNEVVLTSTDDYANTASCTTNVEIIDDLAPVMLCQDIMLNLDSTGSASIVVSDIDIGSVDNCSIVLDINLDTFTCADYGTNPVTYLTGTDESGNIAQCLSTITILDDIDPEIYCVDPFEISLDINGEAFITPATIDNGSIENCTFDLAIDHNVFTADNTGDNTILLTLTDHNNDEYNCTTVVTVLNENLPVCSTEFTPVDGSVGVTLDQVLTWNNTGTEEGIFLNIGLTPGGSEIMYNTDMGMIDTYMPLEWDHSTTYYYTISPYNTYGINTACPSISFETFLATEVDVYIPKFFTPNGDGYNDFWKINYKGFIRSIQIYDRFGKLLANVDPDLKGWDGIYDGVQLPDDDYWYEAFFDGGTVTRGHFSLVTR